MTTHDNGDEAFPRPPSHVSDSDLPLAFSDFGSPGMSLRDYFAGEALTGYCADPSVGLPEAVAKDCYAYADAMIKERNKDSNQ